MTPYTFDGNRAGSFSLTLGRARKVSATPTDAPPPFVSGVNLAVWFGEWSVLYYDHFVTDHPDYAPEGTAVWVQKDYDEPDPQYGFSLREYRDGNMDVLVDRKQRVDELLAQTETTHRAGYVLHPSFREFRNRVYAPPIPHGLDFRTLAGPGDVSQAASVIRVVRTNKRDLTEDVGGGDSTWTANEGRAFLEQIAGGTILPGSLNSLQLIMVDQPDHIGTSGLWMYEGVLALRDLAISEGWILAPEGGVGLPFLTIDSYYSHLVRGANDWMSGLSDLYQRILQG